MPARCVVSSRQLVHANVLQGDGDQNVRQRFGVTTGERRILPANEYAGVPHDGDEETCLTIRERERRKRSITASGKTIRICPMLFRLRCCDHLKACSHKRSEMADS